MPELPEIEFIKQQLVKSDVVGSKILDLQILTPKLRYNIDISPSIVNQHIQHIKRRSKCLILVLEDCSLIIGFGMTGILRLTKGNQVVKHDHIKFFLENDLVLSYNDIRRFGYLKSIVDYTAYFINFGPEPLDTEFSLEYLKKVLPKFKTTIKQTIMNQKVVSGVGNIYASEALFLAKIHPQRRSDNLTEDECMDLLHAIKRVLKQAILHGGTSFQDYRHIDGQKGVFVHQLKVYKRQGKSCYNCEDIILKCKIQQRSSFYCPTCQK